MKEEITKSNLVRKLIRKFYGVVGILCILGLLMLAACSNKNADIQPSEDTNEEDRIEIKNYSVIHDDKFGGIYVNISIDDFNSLGFGYGDSVNVYFSTGYSLEDLPYYNGYYVDAGEAILVAYPGLDYIRVGINYGEDLWNQFRAKDPQSHASRFRSLVDAMSELKGLEAYEEFAQLVESVFSKACAGKSCEKENK